jgi:hypothetical protein
VSRERLLVVVAIRPDVGDDRVRPPRRSYRDGVTCELRSVRERTLVGKDGFAVLDSRVG